MKKSKKKVKSKPYPIQTHCPECHMLSVFGHQPHLPGCSEPKPVNDKEKS